MGKRVWRGADGMFEREVSSEVVYECPVFKVERAVVELPSGQRALRWYARKTDAAGAVAVDSRDRLLVTQEYYSASQEVRWRIPMGRIEPDESPQEAARRELREETGLDAARWTLLLSERRPSGWIRQAFHCYLAQDLSRSPLVSGEVEQIALHWLTRSEVESKIANAEFGPGVILALTRALSLLARS
jgi:8-oxo-dGTP pyrophosphatase MutT (NUDIX family)